MGRKNEESSVDTDQLDPDNVSVDSPPAEHADRHFVTALARGLDVLRCFNSGDLFLANHEIAARCGLPRSTVTRLTYTLTRLGFLHLVPDSGKYRLGTAAVALGSAMLVNLDVRRAARPLMQSLAERTDSVVALATRDRLAMLYLECCRSTSIVTLSLDVGSRLPLATSAIGRAYLAGLPAAERADLLERLGELDDAKVPEMRRAIEHAVEELETTGCVSSMGDWVKSVHGLAVPFNPGRGLPMMAISAAGAAQLFPKQMMLGEIRPQLIQTVADIERSMGIIAAEK